MLATSALSARTSAFANNALGQQVRCLRLRALAATRHGRDSDASPEALGFAAARAILRGRAPARATFPRTYREVKRMREIISNDSRDIARGWRCAATLGRVSTD